MFFKIHEDLLGVSQGCFWSVSEIFLEYLRDLLEYLRNLFEVSQKCFQSVLEFFQEYIRIFLKYLRDVF